MAQSIISVGIDIGTSTTQLVFSKIKIENTAAAWTVPTIKIIGKEIIYKSKVHFTPLENETTIDSTTVRSLIEKEYELANIDVKKVDTGAVIITGETARKDNAREVLDMLSGLAGDFVVATAGPDLEGIIAGKGSGAAKYSKNHGCTVVNYDIGGGTTNIAVFKNGDVIDTACLDVGGRLIKIDKDLKVTYLSKKMIMLCEKINMRLNIGMILDKAKAKQISDIMADVLIQIICKKKKDEYLELLITDHDLRALKEVNYVCFSGGVADCIKKSELDEFKFGDIGVVLGEAIKNKFSEYELTVLSADETISATVVGAGSHTTDISGSTVTFNEEVLPIKNIPIIRLSEDEENAVGEHRINSINNKVNWFKVSSNRKIVALSIRGSRSHGFDDIQALASDIVSGMKELVENNLPLIVLVDNDNAKILGRSMRERLRDTHPIICLDTVSVDNGDYIDVGRPVAEGQVIPVIIKTLLFGY